MSDAHQQDILAVTGPTMKDRINHPYILANQILTIQKAILNLENSEQITEEAVEGLIHVIPENWKDEKFGAEIEKAFSEIDEDVRPEFCGVKASETFCKTHNIDTTHKTKKLDHWRGLQACINLLDRKHMLSKKQFTEIMTGKPANTEESDVTATEIDEF